MSKSERVNSMLAVAAGIFVISFVLHKLLQVQQPGANTVAWWIVAVGKMFGMVGVGVFGAWALKLKLSAQERADG